MATLMVASLTLAGAGCTVPTLPPPVPHGGQERALSHDAVSKVALGMTRDDVRALLGAPARIGTDRLSGREEWMWRYTRAGIHRVCFYVRFAENGRVAASESMLERMAGGSEDLKPC